MTVSTITRPLPGTPSLPGPGPANRLAPGFDALLIDAAATCGGADASQVAVTLTREAWACWGPPEVTQEESARLWRLRDDAARPLHWTPLSAPATRELAQALRRQGSDYRLSGLPVTAEDCADLAEWLSRGRLTVWTLGAAL
jgi:hypothetical protein